jgi:hypothetical protein
MSYKIRLKRFEKTESGDRLWTLIGIGKPKDFQHKRVLEIQARRRFYASGGDREVYLVFLPFHLFHDGFYG